MIQKHQEILNSIDSNIKIKERFIGGMSNYTYLCSDGDAKYAFRVAGEGGHNFVDYHLEEKNIHKIEHLGINSTTVKLEPETGLKLAEYIEGDILSPTVELSRIVEVLRKLHTSNIKLDRYGHLDRLSRYEAIHNNHVEEYKDLKQKFIVLFENNVKHHINYPCHNDAQIANFIHSDEDKIFLLDWEFAGRNDFIYDIASFGNVDFNRAIALLHAYIEEPESDHFLRLYTWRMFQCLQWFNVASYKHETGMSEKLHVPFDKVSEKYINLANEMYDNAIKYLED